jgi:hypothetical protein
MVSPFLQPNSAERKEIAAILLQPPSRDLTGEERQVLWRFRFSLTNEKRALTKFLKCVDWSDAQESKQATDLMHRWASIDIADALELLSPAFVSEEVDIEFRFPFLLVLVLKWIEMGNHIGNQRKPSQGYSLICRCHGGAVASQSQKG